jgi:uncharacterized protein (TIGR02246 family)
MDANDGAVRAVIEQWDEAWSHHDADALAELHHPDAETFNRFGQYLHGREEHQQQLRWLHTGPFKASQSPPQKVVGLRWIRPDVAVVHTAWATPELHLEGWRIPAEDMVVTYLVTNEGGHWGLASVDLHNVTAAGRPDTRLPETGASRS